MAWVSAPPSRSPSDPPPAAIALKIPNALARSRDPSKVTVRSPRADGARRAPNAPWRARAATSTPNDWARPPIAEAVANPTSPPISVHLRPKRSPSLPPRSSRLPNDRAYAVMTHWRLVAVKCNARWADGRAMFTTVASSTTISWATPSRARMAHRLGALAPGRIRERKGRLAVRARVLKLMTILRLWCAYQHHTMNDPCRVNKLCDEDHRRSTYGPRICYNCAR